MASPFSIFRRHQRVMIAVVGVLAMITFVFLTPIMQYSDDSEERANEPVVESKYGSLNARALSGMVASRQIVKIFLQNLAFVTAQALVARNEIPPEQQDQAADYLYRTAEQLVMTRSQNDEERAAVETMILANKARELGVIVNDDAINDFFKQVTRDTVESKELTRLIRELRYGDQPISENRLFEALRNELLATRVTLMYTVGLQVAPPAQRFDYFSRMNRKATIEYAPVVVSTFLDKVPEPSKEEVQQFYERYRERLPDPDSPEPGFKQPHRAAWEYFKADFDAVVEKIDVSEDEIRKYYEANKETFKVTELPDEGAEKPKPTSEPELPDSPEASGQATPPGESSTEKPPAGETGTEKPPIGEPGAEKPPAGEPEAEQPQTDKPQTPAETPPAGEQPSTPADDQPPEEKPEPKSAIKSSARFLLASDAKAKADQDAAAPDREPADAIAQDEKGRESKSDDAAPAAQPAAPTEPAKPGASPTAAPG